MSLEKGLVIFRSDGSMLNKTTTAGAATFYLNMKKTSVDLIENETLYLLEKTSTGAYTKPSFSNMVEFSKDDDRFDCFSVNDGELVLGINKDDLIAHVSNTISYDQFGYVVETTPNPTPLTINTMFSSKEDGAYDCRMVLSDSLCTITIVLYCEVDDADERMINLLSRFGESIGKSDEQIFLETDINEDLPSASLLNDKRKELLNIYGELSPYFPTMFGLKIVLSYFGYRDILYIKEYYLDNSSGKIVSFDEGDPSPNKLQLTKLNSFGMFYDINRVVENEYDEYGDPLLVDVMPMSYEEIAIKLFGLKSFIEKRDIGGASKIVDIIGQKINFARLKVRHWKNRNQSFTIDKNIYPSIEKIHFDEYLVDLRIYDNFSCPFSQDDDLRSVKVYDLKTCYVSYFASLYVTNPIFFDEPNSPVGSKLIVQNTSFDVSWKSVDAKWVENGLDQPMTWFNVGSNQYHKVIFFVSSTAYANTIEIDPNSQNTAEFILPHVGEYDLTITLVGFDGLVSKKTYKGYASVKMCEVEFTSFYKMVQPELQKWNSNLLKFGEVWSSWNRVIYDNSGFLAKDGDVNMSSFAMANFLSYNKPYGYGDIGFKGYLNKTWKTLKNLSWADAHYDYTIPPKAIMTKFKGDEVFYINGDKIKIPQDINSSNYHALCAYLNSTLVDYNFVNMKDYNNNDFIEIIGINNSNKNFYISSSSPNISFASAINLQSWTSFISGVGLWGSWGELGIPWDTSIYRSDSKQEEFSLDNIRIYNNELTIPNYIPLFFTSDNCSIVGKTECVFSIFDENDTKLAILHGFGACFRFEKSGLYSVACDIKDSNGNKKQIYKKNIINVVEYVNY